MNQEHIDKMQAIYKEWQQLQPKLDQAYQDLQRSATLIKALQDFYFDGQWREIYEQIENGEPFDLTTEGEYSVMSEDTLWNAIADHDSTLWDFMRFCVKHLDKGNDKP